jgi:hypothetical protein
MRWHLVNPEGACRSVSMAPAVRPMQLAGSTVGLAWNGKPGGDHALDEVAALLTEQFADVRIVKFWETVPASVSPRELSDEVIRAMAAARPDVVVVSQGD